MTAGAETAPNGARARATALAKAWAPGLAGTSCGILMYHRVTSGGADPWDLQVPPAVFDRQIGALRAAGFGFTTVEALARCFPSGEPPRRTVAISFDDGYRMDEALPILERYDAAATVFVTSDYAGGEREFWWDALEAIFLQPRRLPGVLVIGDGPGATRLAIDPGDPPHVAWRATAPPPTSRHRAFLAAWRHVRALTERERAGAVDALWAWAGHAPTPRESHRPMRAAEIRALAQGGRVEIGAHTRSHPALAGLPVAEQWRELEGGRRALEAITGQAVRGLSLPHGSASHITRPLAALAGYRYVAGSEDRQLRGLDLPWALPRMVVTNGPLHAFHNDIVARLAAVAAP